MSYIPPTGDVNIDLSVFTPPVNDVDIVLGLEFTPYIVPLHERFNVILKYYDSDNVAHQATFNVLNVKGIDKPWKWLMVPSKIFEFVDGHKETQYKGFQRYVLVELSPIDTNESFIRDFLKASVKSVLYQGLLIAVEEVNVIFEGVDVENEWVEDFKPLKKYTFELKENTVKTSWN
jgi:hypothetical protein